MRKSFTLAEIIIAVVIISFLGMGLLKLQQNSINFFEFMINKMELSNALSIASVDGDIKYNNLEKELDAILDVKFIIDLEKFKELLKQKLTYKEEEVSSQEFELYDDMKVDFIIKKVSISNENSSAYIYKFGLEDSDKIIQ